MCVSRKLNNLCLVLGLIVSTEQNVIYQCSRSQGNTKPSRFAITKIVCGTLCYNTFACVSFDYREHQCYLGETTCLDKTSNKANASADTTVSGSLTTAVPATGSSITLNSAAQTTTSPVGISLSPQTALTVNSWTCPGLTINTSTIQLGYNSPCNFVDCKCRSTICSSTNQIGIPLFTTTLAECFFWCSLPNIYNTTCNGFFYAFFGSLSPPPLTCQLSNSSCSDSSPISTHIFCKCIG